MKILLLTDPNATHSIKWITSLSSRGLEVMVFSLTNYDASIYELHKNIKIVSAGINENRKFLGEKSLSKLIYIKYVRLLRKIIAQFNPDIVHAHYASSYGILGALSGFHPLIVSVWGSDIYNFPNHSLIHRAMIKFNLSKADKILSTSYTMKKETNKFTNKDIIVTPFGIDVNKFHPQKVNSLFEPNDLVIGTIKTLEKKYGIEFLIRAFQIVKEKYHNDSLKLLIVGSGSQEQYLKKLVHDYNIQNDTVFTGYIKSDSVQIYHNMIDIYVAASTEDSESFGVAILEASSCAKPVIVSNVGGLSEVVENGKTGFVVKNKSSESIAEALEKLVTDERLRIELGKNGRNKVIQEYNWIDCVEKMISIYNTI